MSENLLHQIQMEAVDGAHDLPSLLRKCRVLAQRLDNADLKSWVVSELDGYDEDADLPEYRVLKQGLLLGDYFGAFGAELRNMQIPLTAITEKYRDIVAGVKFLQGVREIHAQIVSVEGGTLRIAVPPEAHGCINNPQIRGDMVLGNVVKHVNASFLEGILETVRNRILNFTLEVESEAPKTGDPIQSLRAQKSDRVQQIFNTEIRGNVSNFAQGSSDFRQKFVVPKGDVGALRTALESIGLAEELKEEIVAAATTESATKKGFGSRVSGLLGTAFSKASEGVLGIPGSVAGNLLFEALKGYYGL